MDCLFCKIIHGEVPSYKVYEDDVCYAFLDIHPTENGDTLIIPKKHYEDLYALEDEVYTHIFKIAKDLGKTYKEKLHCTGFSLCQNMGSAQEVKHYHLHLIPKYQTQEKKEIEEIYQQLI